jgi:hypothetical protein
MSRITWQRSVFAYALALYASGCETSGNDEQPMHARSTDAGLAGASGDSGGGAQSTAHEDEQPPSRNCVETKRDVVRPLSGPGFDAGGNLLGEPQQRYIAHTTEIALQDGKTGRFFELLGPVLAQLDAITLEDGLIGYGLARDPTCDYYRTIGLWTSEEAMYAFAGSGAHVTAMLEVEDIGQSGKVAHWDATPEDMPLTWERAVAELERVDDIFSGYAPSER